MSIYRKKTCLKLCKLWKWCKEGEPVNWRQVALGWWTWGAKASPSGWITQKSCCSLNCWKPKAGHDKNVLEHTVHHSFLFTGRRQAGGLKQCYALGNVLLGNLSSWHSCTCTNFLEIVADHVHSFMAMVFVALSGLLQQDNAPCHTAVIVQEWLEGHCKEFKVLPWPPNSDLNPIEHLWQGWETLILEGHSPAEFSSNPEKPWEKILSASWRPWLAASGVFD